MSSAAWLSDMVEGMVSLPGMAPGVVVLGPGTWPRGLSPASGPHAVAAIAIAQSTKAAGLAMSMPMEALKLMTNSVISPSAETTRGPAAMSPDDGSLAHNLLGRCGYRR